jgi:hypothetical protein
VLLGYEDLSLLLLTSLATLKRDISCLEAKGLEVLLRGRRKKRSRALDGSHTLVRGDAAGYHGEPVDSLKLFHQGRIA